MGKSWDVCVGLGLLNSAKDWSRGSYVLFLLLHCYKLPCVGLAKKKSKQNSVNMQQNVTEMFVQNTYFWELTW